ncbi:MAG TPA: hypothetical protein VJ647_04545, partial [Chitinophagaceae bacterium]|nr:hypothetical protein [Chitinophagaceae bacterium]
QIFTFETALQGKTVNYSGHGVDPNNNSNSDFTIKKVAAGIKLAKQWGAAVGFMPFSSVSYAFSTPKNITGSSAFDGNGGINQVFFANAYRISKNFSVGINSSYLFGGINQTENILDPNAQATIASNRNVYYRKFNFSYGLQYFAKVNKHLNYNLGVTYSPENTLKGEKSLVVTDNSQGFPQVIRNEIINDVRFTLPATFGVGMSVTHNNVLTFATDYKYQAWSDVNHKEPDPVYTNSHRFSAGIDYSKLKNTQANGQSYTYEKYNLQAGAFYHETNLKINGRQIDEYGITLGGGMPVTAGRINLNLALELGSRGSTGNNLVRETYGQLTLNISFRDYWYTKGKRYD